MNTREIAKEYRLSHWTDIMRERAESGQSIREFCRVRGCHENVYYYWQRKLREAASREFGLVETGSAQLTPAGWALCAPKQATGGGVSIECGAYKVAVEVGFDAELLAKVLRILKSQC